MVRSFCSEDAVVLSPDGEAVVPLELEGAEEASSFEDAVVALLFLLLSLSSPLAAAAADLPSEGADVVLGCPVVPDGDAVVTESSESAPEVESPVVGGRVAGTVDPFDGAPVVVGGGGVGPTVVGGGGGGVGLTTRRNSYTMSGRREECAPLKVSD